MKKIKFKVYMESTGKTALASAVFL